MMLLEEKKLVIGTLASDAFVTVNKQILRHFEGDSDLALMLGELIAIYQYNAARHSLDFTDAFPLPIRMLEKNLCFSAYKQQRTLRALEQTGFVTSAVYGRPSCRYISLNFAAIASLLSTPEADNPASKNFYEQLSLCARERKLCRLAFEKALDNVSEPLRGAIVLVSKAAWQPNITWTPENLGVLKHIVRRLQKGEFFDYGRLWDACCAVRNASSLSDFIKELSSTWKTTNERALELRRYDYAEWFDN
jgi:hypothetical protein